jgi:acyl carrier protein
MEDSAMLERIRPILADVLQCPSAAISPGTSANDLEKWDSLNHLSLILALEQEFQVNFTPQEIERMLSVEAISEVVRTKTAP